MKITENIHPEYAAMLSNWEKWRLSYDAGQDFIDTYLKQYSVREDMTVFNKRKELTYVPAFAKAAINDVKNAIFQRAADIKRIGGSVTYQQSVIGLLGGVDKRDSSLNGFIGSTILSELLVMAKVGIYVDMDREIGLTRAEVGNKHPYLYIYKAEDICNWLYDSSNKLVKLLLRAHMYEVDPLTGLPTKLVHQYRFFNRTEDGVLVVVFNDNGIEIGGEFLALPEIPFIMPEISQSLMADIAGYQIALLNLASSDLHYAITSNFPFYTEQFDPRTEALRFLRTADDKTAEVGDTPVDGTASDADSASNKQMTIGVSQGRRYPINTERPGFIHPSSEPLQVSMDKQERMKSEIREIINLSVANIKPKMVSAESRQIENEGLESGLAAIGLVLEATERQIAKFWHIYESANNDVVISYPKIYSLKSDDQRIKEAKEKNTLLVTMPSLTYRREMAKDIAQLTLGHRVSPDVMQVIFMEIDKCQAILNTEAVLTAKEAALLSDAFAATLLGIPPEEAKKGAEDHYKRLERMASAQAKETEDESDEEPDEDSSDENNDATDEDALSRRQRKRVSQDATTNPNGTKRVRGRSRRF